MTIPQSCDSLATDKAERILNILESQSKTIYDRSSLVAIQLPLLKGAKNVVQGEGMVRFWEGRCAGVTIPQSCDRCLATDKAERILNILESQSKTIYDRSSLVAIQLPLAREPSVIVQG